MQEKPLENARNLAGDTIKDSNKAQRILEKALDKQKLDQCSKMKKVFQNQTYS